MLTASAQDRPPRAAAARRGALARRPLRRTGSRRPSSTASSARSSRRGRRRRSRATGSSCSTSPRSASAPPRFSIQVNSRDQGHARLRVLHREPAARALRAGGHPGDHRLRRAQAAPPRGVSAPARAQSALAVARGARARSRSPPGSCARAAAGDGPPDAAARLVPAERARLRAPLDRPRARGRRPPRAARRRAAAGRPRCATGCAAAVSPQAFDLERDVRPWLGDELAYAAVSPADSRRARRGRRPPEGGGARRARSATCSAAERYRGVRVLVAGPTALAFVGDFLALGTEAAVRAAVDRDQGDGARARGPAGLPARRRRPRRPSARSTPTPRRPGCARCSRRATGCSARSARCSTGPGCAPPAPRSPRRSGGLRAHVRLAGGAPRDAAFEPAAARARPGGRRRATSACAARCGSSRVLERLGARGPVERLRRDARRRGRHRRSTRDLLAPLAGELALAVTGAGEDPAGTGGGAPVVTLKARTADPRRTEGALARLQEPLARRLALPGTVPGVPAASRSAAWRPSRCA